MKKGRVILILLALACLAAGIWIFSRPQTVLVIKGSLPPADIAAVKSLVKQDMAKRLLPDYSWASFKGLFSNARAYFKYNIVEINSHGPGEATVKVGDGWSVEASKHVCEYHLSETTNGWAVHLIFSGRSLFVGSAPAMWYPPPANRAGAGPFDAATLPQRRMPTNLATPPISLRPGSTRPDLGLPPLPTDGASPTISSSYTLTLRTPPTTHLVTGVMPLMPGTNGVPVITTFSGTRGPGRIMTPTARGSLTNLMPLGK